MLLLLPEDRDCGVFTSIALDDFLERAGAFQNEVIVLTHRSGTARRSAKPAALPETLARRVTAFLPD
jgi:hypothetical protein